jgi:phosphoglycolate phosphatase
LIPRFPVYLFDIDGTLLDSAPDICAALSHAISEAGIEPPPLSYLRQFIGLHLTETFSDVFPDCGADRMESLIQAYRTNYHGRGHLSTSPYPGVMEGLPLIPGRKSTATTKGTPMATAILEQFGLRPYFDHIQGTDGFPSKPAPDVILAALNALNAKPEDCLMVGDATADIEAARAAGVKVCIVRYGYGDPAALAGLQPDYWIDRLDQLAGL